MSYIISFFKIIFIWFGLVVASVIPGYVLNVLVKPLKIRMFVGVGLGVGLIALGILNVVPGSILYYILCSVYVLSVLILIQKDFFIKDEYKKISYLSSNIDLAWAVIFGNIFNILFISFPELQRVLPFYIRHFDIYLYLNYLLFLVMPVYIVTEVISRISRIESKILKNKIITGDEIFQEYNSMLSENDTEEEKVHKLDNLLEIINHFEESGKIIKVDVDREGYMYVELDTYKIIKSKINKFLEGEKKVDMNEMSKSLSHELNQQTTVIENIIYYVMSTYEDWINFKNIFIEGDYIKEIESAIKNQIIAGKFNALEIEAKYLINKSVLEEIIKYCQIEIINEQKNEKNNFEDYKEQLLSDFACEKKENPVLVNEKVIIDVNFASEEDFRNICSFGIILSRKIIQYREGKNGFESVEEFLEFTQISPHKIALIKEKLKCTPRAQVAKKLIGRRLEI